jgi:hypothetical protein
MEVGGGQTHAIVRLGIDALPPGEIDWSTSAWSLACRLRRELARPPGSEVRILVADEILTRPSGNA